MSRIIIKTVMSVSLLAFIPAYAVSKAEQQAYEVGCINTWRIQYESWVLGTDNAAAILKAAEIENCICSNDGCRKASSKGTQDVQVQKPENRSGLSRLLESDEAYEARKAGCKNTYDIQNNSWVLFGGSDADANAILRAAEIENCSCSNGKCRKR